ncbi:MAG: peptide-methionine (S)-S-oxide reductase [Verrucomicrobiales bacterium]|jgi:peptide-methionine (S)-S-oxide reductase
MTSSWKWTIWFGVAACFMWSLTLILPKGDQRRNRVDLSELRAGSASPNSQPRQDRLVTATLGGGCFWCVEAVLERIKGVASVESGYSGGEFANPTYADISRGKSGHVECVRVRFDPEVLSYEQLLTVFWELHDPTTKNRQGADRGTQYRSAIFYHDDLQKRIAEESLARKDASDDLRRGIVTVIAPATKFYPAEAYHQDYFEANPNAGYCRQVISPKLKKLGLLE